MQIKEKRKNLPKGNVKAILKLITNKKTDYPLVTVLLCFINIFKTSF